MKRICIPLGLLLLALPLHAQRVTSPYRFLEHGQHVAIYGGYLTTQEGVIGAGPHSAPSFGVSWGYAVSGPVKLIAELGFTPTQRTVRDTAVTVTAGDSVFRALGDADMLLLSILGSVRLDLTGQRTWHGLQPFVLSGAGAVIDVAGRAEIERELPTSERFDFGTSFAAQLGAGVEWYPSMRFSARLDGRGLFWKLSVPEAFQLSGRRFAGSEWEMNVLVALGFAIHF